MTTDTDAAPLTELVCLGACTLTGGKKGLRWCAVADLDDAEAKAFAFPRKLKSGAMSETFVGAVVSVPMEEHTVTFGRAKFIRSIAGDPRVSPWALKHEAAIGAERSEAYFKSEKSKAFEKSLEAMEPLRRAYKSTDHWGRLIIEARLLQHLRNP